MESALYGFYTLVDLHQKSHFGSISDTPQLVCKHRTRALSMKYSIYSFRYKSFVFSIIFFIYFGQHFPGKLKNRKSLLACSTLSSLLLTFFKRRSSRRMFLLRTKEYYCTFSNKCFQEIMWSLGVLYFQMQRDISGRRRIVLLAKKPHRDKPEQNMEQLTCLSFQASCYLSPSPKERKK